MNQFLNMNLDGETKVLKYTCERDSQPSATWFRAEEKYSVNIFPVRKGRTCETRGLANKYISKRHGAAGGT